MGLHPVPEPGAGDNSFLKRMCLPFLAHAQNLDGGWGGRPATASAIEPTAWALLALTVARAQGSAGADLAKGERWLTSQQLPDGSFPAQCGMTEGSWVTSIAGWALHVRGTTPSSVEQASQWLVRSRPRQQPVVARMRQWLASVKVAGQNDSLMGWSWTPRTSSWVEPTAYAMLFLKKLGVAEQSPAAAQRLRSATAMLLDRVCMDGGWNCGNPKIYGMATEPQVMPTAWALLALRPRGRRAELEPSLQWLEQAAPQAAGSGSAALAHLCLQTYGRKKLELETLLWKRYRANQLLENVVVASWCALALLPDFWLPGEA